MVAAVRLGTTMLTNLMRMMTKQIIMLTANDNSMGSDGDDSITCDNESVASINSNGVRVKFYDPYDFDAEVFELLKANDRSAVSVWFHNNPLEHIDWGKELVALSKNTHLKVVDIWCGPEEITSERDRRYAERNAKNFYRAVAAFRSLKYLTIRGSIVRGLDMGEIFTILSPSFQNNLCNLTVHGISLDSTTMEVLESALSKCNLRSFGLNWCEGMNKEVMETIVDILASNPNIESLSLSDFDMDEEAVVLGNALSNTTISLKKFCMSRDTGMGSQSGSISQNGIGALSESLSAQNSTLEMLQLHSVRIGIEGGIILAHGLTNNTVLKNLDLYMAVSPGHEEYIMSPTGWNVFFNGLKNCCFHKLCLGGNTIGDEDIETMVDALNTMNLLKDLNLRDARITSSGWTEFFSLMQHPGSVFGRLTHLNIMSPWDDECRLDREGAKTFAKALVNSSLQKLDLGMGGFIGDDQEGAWDTLSIALCDKSSIESICKSNHTLEENLRKPSSRDLHDFLLQYSASYTEEEYEPDEYTRIICPLLQLNKGTNKAEVIRQKIFQYYFSEEHNLHELLNMDMGVLPYVLEAIGKEASGFNLLYQVVQGVPLLFDAKSKVTTGKRKSRD